MIIDDLYSSAGFQYGSHKAAGLLRGGGVQISQNDGDLRTSQGLAPEMVVKTAIDLRTIGTAHFPLHSEKHHQWAHFQSSVIHPWAWNPQYSLELLQVVVQPVCKHYTIILKTLQTSMVIGDNQDLMIGNTASFNTFYSAALYYMHIEYKIFIMPMVISILYPSEPLKQASTKGSS